jgi:hypothetical protein
MAKKRFFGILCAALVCGLLIPGCKDGGGGGMDSALVATWHTSQTAANNGTNALFELTADGRLLDGGQGYVSSGDWRVVTVGASRISATCTSNGQTLNMGSADYDVSGTELRFSNFGAGDSSYNIFQTLSIAGSFYRSGNGNGNGNGNTSPSSFKPNKLNTSPDFYTGTSYAKAVAKLDEIITYCNNNPGTVNDAVLANAVQLKTGMSAFQSTWSSSGTTAIESINSLIDTTVGYAAPHLSVLNLSEDFSTYYYSEALITTTTLSKTSNYNALLGDSNTMWTGKRIEGIFYPDWPDSTSFSGTFNVFVKSNPYQGPGPDHLSFKFQNNVSFNTKGQATTIDWSTMTPLGD